MIQGLVAARQTRASLRAQLQALGVRAGDVVMVHAGLRAVGPILGGPDELVLALRDAVGADGTLMVYLGSESPFDDLGRDLYGADDEAFIRAHCPPWDAHTARANRDFGYFAEVFRTHPGVVASGNCGARMGAFGRHAEALVRDHARDFGLGRGSPLERMVDLGGQVLLLGADHDNVTLLHYAEAVAPIMPKRTVRIEVPVMREGHRTWQAAEEFDSNLGIRDWPERWFATLVDDFAATGAATAGRVGGADALLMPAPPLVEFAVQKMVALAEASAACPD